MPSFYHAFVDEILKIGAIGNDPGEANVDLGRTRSFPDYPGRDGPRRVIPKKIHDRMLPTASVLDFALGDVSRQRA